MQWKLDSYIILLRKIFTALLFVFALFNEIISELPNDGYCIYRNFLELFF